MNGSLLQLTFSGVNKVHPTPLHEQASFGGVEGRMLTANRFSR